MVPSTVVHGHSVFEWLEGEKFLIVPALRELVQPGPDG